MSVQKISIRGYLLPVNCLLLNADMLSRFDPSPCGHTHDEIDARFGVLWQHAKQRNISGPLEYRSMIFQAYSTDIPTVVEDLFVVPDNGVILRDNEILDGAFGRYAKGRGEAYVLPVCKNSRV